MTAYKEIEVFKIDFAYILVKSKDIDLFPIGKYININKYEYKVEDITPTDLDSEKLVKLSTVPTTLYCKIPVAESE